MIALSPEIFMLAMAGGGAPPAPIIGGNDAWIGYAVMFALLALVLLVSLKGSKRALQD